MPGENIIDILYKEYTQSLNADVPFDVFKDNLKQKVFRDEVWDIIGTRYGNQLKFGYNDYDKKITEVLGAPIVKPQAEPIVPDFGLQQYQQERYEDTAPQLGPTPNNTPIGEAAPIAPLQQTGAAPIDTISKRQVIQGQDPLQEYATKTMMGTELSTDKIAPMPVSGSMLPDYSKFPFTIEQQTQPKITQTSTQKEPPLYNIYDTKDRLLDGNIDIANRPIVTNSDGTISTIQSISVNQDGKEYLIPTINEDGLKMTDDEAYAHFQKTGKHLGAFKDVKAATEYAKNLSEYQGIKYSTSKKLEELKKQMSTENVPFVSSITKGVNNIFETAKESVQPKKTEPIVKLPNKTWWETEPSWTESVMPQDVSDAYKKRSIEGKIKEMGKKTAPISSSIEVDFDKQYEILKQNGTAINPETYDLSGYDKALKQRQSEFEKYLDSQTSTYQWIVDNYNKEFNIKAEPIYAKITEDAQQIFNNKINELRATMDEQSISKMLPKLIDDSNKEAEAKYSKEFDDLAETMWQNTYELIYNTVSEIQYNKFNNTENSILGKDFIEGIRNVVRRDEFMYKPYNDKIMFFDNLWKGAEKDLISKGVSRENIDKAKGEYNYYTYQALYTDRKGGYTPYGISKMADKILQEVDTDIAEVRKNMNNAYDNNDMSAFEEYRQEYLDLDASKNNLQKIQYMSDLEKQGFIRGLTADPIAPLPFISGLSSLGYDLDIYGIAQKQLKYETTKDEQYKLTDSENTLLRSHTLYQEAQSNVPKTMSYSIGETSAISTSYMLEYIMLAGFAETAARATIKATVAQGMKTLFKTAPTRTTVRYITKPLEYVVQAAAITSMQPHRFIDNYVKEITPQMRTSIVDDSVALAGFTKINEDPILKNMWVGFAETYSENLSERMGGLFMGTIGRATSTLFKKAGASPELMKRLAFGTFMNYVDRKLVSALGTKYINATESLDAFSKYLSKRGIGSIAQEMEEEIYNAPLSKLLTGDTSHNWMYPYLKDDTLDVDWKQLGIMGGSIAFSVGGMQVIGATAQGINNIKYGKDRATIYVRDVNGSVIAQKVSGKIANRLYILNSGVSNGTISANEINEEKKKLMPTVPDRGNQKEVVDIAFNSLVATANKLAKSKNPNYNNVAPWTPETEVVRPFIEAEREKEASIEDIYSYTLQDAPTITVPSQKYGGKQEISVLDVLDAQELGVSVTDADYDKATEWAKSEIARYQQMKGIDDYIKKDKIEILQSFINDVENAKTNRVAPVIGRIAETAAGENVEGALPGTETESQGAETTTTEEETEQQTGAQRTPIIKTRTVKDNNTVMNDGVTLVRNNRIAKITSHTIDSSTDAPVIKVAFTDDNSEEEITGEEATDIAIQRHLNDIQGLNLNKQEVKWAVRKVKGKMEALKAAMGGKAVTEQKTPTTTKTQEDESKEKDAKSISPTAQGKTDKGAEQPTTKQQPRGNAAEGAKPTEAEPVSPQKGEAELEVAQAKVELGKTDEVLWARQLEAKTTTQITYGIVEADDVEASHTPDGRRNPNHTIGEAQPKERSDLDSIKARESIRDTPELRYLGADNTAYLGSPIVAFIDGKYQVIQGNNRAIGLKMGYAANKTSYKNQLNEQAAQFGITPEQLSKFKNPVLVRIVDANKAKAIKLGQYKSEDIETGAKTRLDDATMIGKMSPNEKAKLAELVFADEEITLNKAIRDNINDIFKLLAPHLTPSNRKAILNTDGSVNANGIKDIESLVNALIYDGNVPLRDGIQYVQPAQLNIALMMLAKVYAQPKTASTFKDLQNALLLIAVAGESVKSSQDLELYLNQYDMFTGRLNSAPYNNMTLWYARKIIEISKSTKEERLRAKADAINAIKTYNQLVLGSPKTLLDEAVLPISKEEAIKQAFKIDYNDAQGISVENEALVQEAPRQEGQGKQAQSAERAAEIEEIRQDAIVLASSVNALFGVETPVVMDVDEIDKVLDDLGIDLDVENTDEIKFDDLSFSISVNGEQMSVRRLPNELSIINGFYSPIEKRLAETKIEKQSANKWLTSGVIGKGDEAIWTGVKQWLESKNPQEQVSKSEIQQFLKDNRISVVEVVKGELSENEIKKRDKLLAELDDVGRKKTLALLNGDNLKRSELEEKENELFEQLKPLSDRTNNALTKFSQYQLEGEKENYKEIVIVLPREGQMAKVGDYVVPAAHSYGEDLEDRRRLVHLRMNTRTDADGNKVLFLEEVQSDWGQTGKKEGFSKPFIDKELEKWLNGSRKEDATLDRLIDKYNIDTEEGIESQLESELKKQKSGIPTAPFVTDTNAWVKLGLKVALKEAVKQGADKIAWTTGEQQNERYDLSKSVDEVYVAKNNQTGGWFVDASKNGNSVIQKDIKNDNELAETIGKELAERAIKEGGGEYKGQDLKVGGKGMKGFYGSPTVRSTTVEHRGEWSVADLKEGNDKGFKILKEGKEIGSVSSLIDEGKGIVSIEHILINEKDRGVGSGRDAYISLIKYLDGKGLKLKTDNDTITPQAKRVWDSLVKSGWAEETNEGYISKYNDKELGIVGNVAKSLFKQEPKIVSIDVDKPLTKTLATTKGDDGKYYVFEGDNYNVPLSPKFDTQKEAAEYLPKVRKQKTSTTQHSIDITPELKAEVEEGLPLFMIDKMQSDSDVLREGQRPIGSVMSVGLTARERFKISALNRIGAGSDRVVFDLGNDRVLKVAKTARGLYQNSQEGEAYLEGIVPTKIEEGDNYVVVAKASKIKANDTVPIYNNDGDEIGVTTARQMFKELDETPIYEYGKNNVYTSKFQDWASKYGFMDVLSYDILPGDFKRKTNWGYANGRPIHIDAGTFGGTRFIEDYSQKTNMQDADFREAYYRSKQAKKEYQDQDAYAKFSKSNRVALGFAYNNKVYLDPRYARKDTPIHEFGHIWNNVAKERYNDFYQTGLSLIEKEGQVYINEAKSKQPNLKGEQLLEEALAIAIADKGMRLKANEAAGLLGWLKTFWNTVAGAMNLNVTGEQLQNMTLDDYTTLVAGSLMYGTEIKKQVYNPAKAAPPQAPAVPVASASKEQAPAKEVAPVSRKIVHGNVKEINKIEDKRAAAKARIKGKTPPPKFSIETIPAKNKDVTSAFTNLANIYAQLSSTTDKQERRKLTTEIKSVASSNEMVNYIHTNWQKLKNQLNFETKGNCP